MSEMGKRGKLARFWAFFWPLPVHLKYLKLYFTLALFQANLYRSIREQKLFKLVEVKRKLPRALPLSRLHPDRPVPVESQHNRHQPIHLPRFVALSCVLAT